MKQLKPIQCTRCILSNHRKNVVMGRGSIPATILFMGEAPGKTEDTLGVTFVGSSGKLLDKMLLKAAEINQHELPSFYITNTVLCRPCDGVTMDNRAPSEQEVLLCTPNIIKIYNTIKPKLVIFIGKVSEKYYKKEFKNNFSIPHPAFILRNGGEKSPMFMTTVRNLAKKLKEFI